MGSVEALWLWFWFIAYTVHVSWRLQSWKFPQVSPEYVSQWRGIDVCIPGAELTLNKIFLSIYRTFAISVWNQEESNTTTIKKLSRWALLLIKDPHDAFETNEAKFQLELPVLSTQIPTGF